MLRKKPLGKQSNMKEMTHKVDSFIHQFLMAGPSLGKMLLLSGRWFHEQSWEPREDARSLQGAGPGKWRECGDASDASQRAPARWHVSKRQWRNLQKGSVSLSSGATLPTARRKCRGLRQAKVCHSTLWSLSFLCLDNDVFIEKKCFRGHTGQFVTPCQNDEVSNTLEVLH